MSQQPAPATQSDPPQNPFWRLMREGTRHRPGGAWSVLISAGSVAAALYVLWISALATVIGDIALHVVAQLKQFGLPYAGLEAFAISARAFTANYHLDISIFIAITFPIAFLTTTANRNRSNLAWADIALAALSFAVALYYIVLDDKFLHWSRGFSQPTTADVVAGFTLLVLVIELCRRCTGWGLTSLVLVLLAFTFFGHLMPGPLKHENFSVPYFIEMMTVMPIGIFGAPLEVAATYAFLFVLFGNFFEKAGGGKLFFELAGALTGRMIGGAAKACVTASGLYGSVSGSPTADVATTGPLTIPIMKKMGIPAARAGAIEATASSGGAMLPPVMGAVAFIMSDLTGIAYSTIALASLLPALLVPVLRQHFNLPEMQVHLFVLYFACLSAITPPVAVANFAASAIAGVNPMALGGQAMKLAIGGFLLPFFFVFNPGLNMEGGPAAIVTAVMFAAAMVAFASLALHGFLGRRTIIWPLRLVLAGCVVGAIVPRVQFQAGSALLGVLLLVGVWRLVARPPQGAAAQ